MCTALVVGNMIGSGIFLLPAALASFGGISIIGWLLTMLGSLLLARVFVRLVRHAPMAGGPYAYTRLGFGDFAGFLVAWGYWISTWVTDAALAVAFISYSTVFWPQLATNNYLAAGMAIATIWLLTLVNTSSIRRAGRVQLITTVIKLLPLLLIGTIGLFYFNGDHFTPFNRSDQSTLSALSATVTLTLWAFLGLESATIPAHSVANPAVTIPRATILGVAIAGTLYIFGTVSVMGILPPEALAASPAPFAEAARIAWGRWAGYAVAIGAAVSCFGALNGWILIHGQVPYAAALDGLFPRQFAQLSKQGTPVFGLVISSILATLLVSFNYGKNLVELFTFIILLATLTTLVPYIFSSMTALLLVLKEAPQRGFPFRAALVPILAFLYSLWAIMGAGFEIVYWGFILFIMGVPVYIMVADRSQHSEAD